MELYLFRHGHINESGKFIGFSDVDLSDVGIIQQREIEKKLLDLNLDQIFSSDLKRTFVGGGIRISNIREINFGQWEGLSWAIVEKRYPNESKEYLLNPMGFKFPNGETFCSFEKRALSWLDDVLVSGAKRVGAVTHKGVINFMMSRFSGKHFWKINPEYGQMFKITL